MEYKSLSYYIEWTFIFVVHILLLIWILYVLQNAGSFSLQLTLLHFIGLAISGGLLIRITAFLTHRRYINHVKRRSK